MNTSAPHTEFGKTRMVPVKVHLNGEEIESDTWDEVLWIERSEDWYALQNRDFKNKKVRIVEREVWLRCPLVMN